MFVYVIVNDMDWKIYIGKTTRPNLRQYLQKKFWYAAHRPALHSHLYAAIRKYGKENFHIYPLISNLQTDEELCHWEWVLIKSLATQNPTVGYNICRGGEGFTGPHSPETKEKISHASIEMWKRPEIKKNFHDKRLGKTPNRTPEGIEALRHARLGIKASSETIKKLQESHTGLKRSEESRLKQGKSILETNNHFYGETHSEASRAKMREAARHKQYHRLCPKHGRVIIPHSRGKCPLCVTSQVFM